MAHDYINKVVYGDQTLIDLTSDTATAAKVLSGYRFHDRTGAPVTGSCTYDSNTQDGTASEDEILLGEVAYSQGVKITGTMPNNGAVSGSISTKAGQYSVPRGYHDGSGKVGIDSVEQAKIIEGNIKSGVQILGVTGTYTGEAVSAQTKSVTPYTTAQTVLPDSGYDYLAQVNVAAIAYVETDNAAGGKTATIGTVAP